MPIDATLLKKQKNTLLQILRGEGFDPADFEWQEVATVEHNSVTWMSGGGLEYRASKLVHAPTGYYVIFGGLKVAYSPGSNQKLEEDEHLDDWHRRYQSFRGWLQCLREEVNTEDLWATIRRERALPDAVSTGFSNEPFTLAERSRIAEQLGEIKERLLAAQQFRMDQTRFIDAQFNYLKGASERLGRKDWLNTALGGLVGLIVGLALDPEKAKGLMGLAGTLLQWIWGEAGRLLP